MGGVAMKNTVPIYETVCERRIVGWRPVENGEVVVMGTTVGFSDDRLGDEVIWQIVDPRPPLSVLGPPPPIPEPVVPPEISLPPAAWVMLLGVALLILFLKRRQDEIEVRSWRR